MASDRFSEIEQLPADLHDDSLVDWRTVTAMVGGRDIEHTRKMMLAAGLPVVSISARRKLPRLGKLREFLRNREK
jgi:hypothetical protein